MPVQIKRVYEDAEKTDGLRVLVDRLWPRGMSKEDAHVDEWLKEVGPSKELRQWFGHDPDKFEDFKKKYKEELKNNEEQQEELEKLKDWTKKHKKNITLVFGAKDEINNQAVVLKEILDHQQVE
ncbi:MULTISPECIES: DUF488 domain-containing protein [unclassified Sporosarcina]|uniref:DUF488 domain-containing protein n=1 Tax=unclassified Sporosarcina TaxID=2647733 RepID=UPI000C16EFD9|nr:MULTISPECIES: DUF488 family protein [unclassified Sporosarcina]PID05250.1 hypothetical protein CSV66_11085 [Sporosarcina sp. P30]PID08524.1 hypothetical protein CSV65_10675 [Sporosarcina sp. P31]PID11483.1 hypothetical protein CSV64_11420 [Sporosarcina sp. P32b]